MTSLIHQMLGIEASDTVHEMDVLFAAPWAQGRPALVIFACIAMLALGLGFYFKYQKFAGTGSERVGATRWILGLVRSLVLALLVVILAEPVVSLALTSSPRPLFLLLFDGTDSMSIDDAVRPEDADKVASLVRTIDREPDQITRGDLVKAAVSANDHELLSALSESFRVRAYVMDQRDQVRELDLESGDAASQEQALALPESFETTGQITAIGDALADLKRRHRSNLLAGVAVFSDFDQNTGRPAIPQAERLAVPLFTVGVGATEVVDLSVDLQTPLVLKKDERTAVTVHLRQSGLNARSARVQVLGRKLGDESGGGTAGTTEPIAPARMVELDRERISFDVPFTPTSTGRFVFEVKVEPFAEEAASDNNVVQREVTIRDDALKLLFVEFEPTWEWRFVKEVFHRDPLIGPEGFRTFLRSADFRVRRNNDLFLENLIQPRSDFFANDVILISDIRRDLLPDAFHDLVHEYVQKFGGGLVVIAGPRFGVGSLAGTKIGDMLPVILDSSIQPKVSDFALRMTPKANVTDFMNLGSDEHENTKAWTNMGTLPWYQPVLRPHPLADVLADHPRDTCVDNVTPQPIIATRRYGKGEVVYIGFNELWRLRRMYGERYYRQFWGQLIYRLGLGRALGAQKRFQVFTDRPRYKVGDKVRVSIEAYDQDFKPMDTTSLEARLLTRNRGSVDDESTDFSIALSRDRVFFETTVPVYDEGYHRLLIRDPVTQKEREISFEVDPVSVEKRNAVRDVALQQSLATQTGGKFYEIHEVNNLSKDIKVPEITEVTERRIPLWSTWLVLISVLTLMLLEWLIRKLVSLQ